MNRVRAETVTFARPFLLHKINRELPAGSYPVETDEEILEGQVTTVYRRVEIRLFVPRIEGKSDAEMWSINPNDFDKAVARDRELSAARQVLEHLDAPSLTQRTAAFEKDRDDAVHKLSERRSRPFFGACLGVVALLFATWIAHQVEQGGAVPPAARFKLELDTKEMPMILPVDHQAVEVESFQRAEKSGVLGRAQLRPVKGEKFPSNLLLEGNKSLLADYPVGTRFRVQAKIMSRAGGEQYLFSSWQWDVKVLWEPEPV